MMKELAMATLVAGGVCAAARKAKKEAMNAQRTKDFKSGTRNLSSFPARRTATSTTVAARAQSPSTASRRSTGSTSSKMEP